MKLEAKEELEQNSIIAECRELQAEMGSATAEFLDEEGRFKDVRTGRRDGKLLGRPRRLAAI